MVRVMEVSGLAQNREFLKITWKDCLDNTTFVDWDYPFSIMGAVIYFHQFGCRRKTKPTMSPV